MSLRRHPNQRKATNKFKQIIYTIMWRERYSSRHNCQCGKLLDDIQPSSKILFEYIDDIIGSNHDDIIRWMIDEKKITVDYIRNFHYKFIYQCLSYSNYGMIHFVAHALNMVEELLHSKDTYLQIMESTGYNSFRKHLDYLKFLHYIVGFTAEDFAMHSKLMVPSMLDDTNLDWLKSIKLDLSNCYDVLNTPELERPICNWGFYRLADVKKLIDDLKFPTSLIQRDIEFIITRDHDHRELYKYLVTYCSLASLQSLLQNNDEMPQFLIDYVAQLESSGRRTKVALRRD